MSGDDIAKAVEGATIVAFRGAPAGGAERAENGRSDASGGKSADSLAPAGKKGGPPPPGGEAEDGGDGDGIARLNRDHAVVLMGSRAVVLRERFDGPIEDRVKFISVEALKTYFANVTARRVRRERNDDGELVEKVSFVKIAPAWLTWRGRRTYDGIEFFPDVGDAEGTPKYLNLWRGFACAPDPAPAAERRRKYSVFADHLLTNICSGDAETAKWVFAWFASLVQKPREKTGTAIVLRGRMGVGKTVLGNVIGSLFPSHYFLVDDPRYLVGQFNAHMATCLLLQVDEGFWAGDKAAEGRLKGLITADKQMIEAKGVDPIRLDNYVRLLFSSNESWVVPAGMDERRFAVFDVAEHAKENHEYFAELFDQMAKGGREALLADLLAFDLAASDAPNVRAIPKTGALLEQKLRALEPVPQWLHGRLVDGAQTHRKVKWEVGPIAIRTVHADFLRWAERIGVRRKPSDIEFGIAIKKLLPGLRECRRAVEVEEFGSDGHPTTSYKRVRCYEFQSLADCREAFEAALQQPVDWGPADGDGESGESPETDTS